MGTEDQAEGTEDPVGLLLRESMSGGQPPGTSGSGPGVLLPVDTWKAVHDYCEPFLLCSHRIERYHYFLVDN